MASQIESECVKYNDRMMVGDCDADQWIECFVCRSIFCGYDTLETHMKVHENEKPHKCFICEESFSTSSLLRNHIKEHLAVTTRECTEMSIEKCFICKQLFSTLTDLRAHIRYEHVTANANTNGNKQSPEHHGTVKKNVLKQCRSTSHGLTKYFSFFPPFNGLRNIKRKSPWTPGLKCTFCHLTFQSKEKLESHQIELHNKSKTYQCYICKVTLRQHSKLLNHMRIHKETSKSTTCFICHSSFSSVDELNLHEKSSHEVECSQIRHSCAQCNRTYRTSHSLSKHEQRVHTDKSTWNFKCDLCDKKFPAHFELKMHVRLHNGERPYQCEFCGKSYTRKEVLKWHVATYHKKEKFYQCHVCLSKFTHIGNLQRHMKKHTGEKDLLCTKCGASYRSKCGFEYHMKFHCSDGGSRKRRERKMKSSRP